jgi:MinD-like ATPase involved in chromosome partitioning or flagellar assembly
MTTRPPRPTGRTGGADLARPRRLRVVDAPGPETARHAAADSAISETTAESEPAAGPGQARGVRRVTEVRYGPLLAVCGLCGGAGTTTLAYLIAVFAAREYPGSVLVCDTGGPSGALAAMAGVAAPRSPIELATADTPVASPYAEAGDGLRVLATGPRFRSGCPRAGVERVLEQARAAHALTVVDCGTLTRDAEHLVLSKASHIAWVLPATPGGLRRADRVLEAITPHLVGRELVIARRDAREHHAPLSDVKALAADRAATLILVPQLPDLIEAAPAAALDQAQVPLQAILGALQR